MSKHKHIATYLLSRPSPDIDSSIDKDDIPVPPTDDVHLPAPIKEPPDSPDSQDNPGHTPVREPDPTGPKQII